MLSYLDEKTPMQAYRLTRPRDRVILALRASMVHTSKGTEGQVAASAYFREEHHVKYMEFRNMWRLYIG